MAIFFAWCWVFLCFLAWLLDLPLACFALTAFAPVDLDVDGAPPMVEWTGGCANENTQAQESKAVATSVLKFSMK